MTTTTETITIGAVLHHAIALAEANPDFVYCPPGSSAACRYMWNGKGSCIFGQALIKAGVDPERLAAEEDHRLDHPGGAGIAVMLGVLGIDTPSAVSQHVAQAQRHQDNGHRWGGTVLDKLRLALAAL
jgi:hypothetical protein